MSTQDHSLDSEYQKEKQIQALKKELDSVKSEARDMAHQFKQLRSELAALSNERDNDRSAGLEKISRIEMESDLILLQLHQVQEELEYFFNLSSKQAQLIEACAEFQNRFLRILPKLL